MSVGPQRFLGERKNAEKQGEKCMKPKTWVPSRATMMKLLELVAERQRRTLEKLERVRASKWRR